MSIDEFQIIKELNDYKKSFLWVIISYIQNQHNIAYVFTGSMSLNDALISEISGHNGVFGGRMNTKKKVNILLQQFHHQLSGLQ